MIVKAQKIKERHKSESHKNNNEEEVMDTSESFRNIQQEIESLLAPLTPLPELEPVPKIVKNGDDKETFVLMNNRNKSFDNEKSRAGSFEIVENNAKEFYKSKSMDDWSLLGEKQTLDDQNEENETAPTEGTGNESSETETEDQVDSDDDCNGNIQFTEKNAGNNIPEDTSGIKQKKEEEKLPESQINFFDNSTSSLPKSKNMDEVEINNELDNSAGLSGESSALSRSVLNKDSL